MIQAGFDSWTRSGAERYSVSTVNNSKCVETIGSGIESVGVSLGITCTKKQATSKAASNCHLYLEGEIAQPGTIGETHYKRTLPRQMSMKSPIGEETTAIPLTGFAPDAAVRAAQWVVDCWFSPGCPVIDALWRHRLGLRRQKVLRDAGRLGVPVRGMGDCRVIEQSAAADDHESDDDEQ